MRKSGWERGVESVVRRWSVEGVRVRIVDVGTDEATNVSLQELLPTDRTIPAGTPSAWEAVIRNDSARTLTGAKAILRVDDKPTEVALPEIAAHQTARVPLSIPFPGFLKLLFFRCVWAQKGFGVALFCRPEGAATCQPRATSWELDRVERMAPP
jgi:hypothetical protein